MLSLFLVLAALPVFADGFIVVKDFNWRPPGNGPRAYSFAPLEVSWHHVNVSINGQVATTSVDQEFYNPNPQRLEGTYLFPVPKGAQIDKFTMDIGGKQVPAELLPADKARQIYEDIVRQMRDPALLEYADRDVFKVRIFPIEPNSSKHITLSYSQVLNAESGLVSYVYPLNTEKFSSKPVKNVSIKVDLNSPRPLQTIYSPSHDVEISRHGPNRATVGFEARDVRPDTDFALYFAPEKSELGMDLLTSKADGEDGYFLLLETPSINPGRDKIMPKDVVFVLDTSGSMSGRKIEQAKRALRYCVENLNDDDQFELIRFSTEVEPLFDKLLPASQTNRDRALDFIKDLSAVGSTAIDEALHKALSMSAGSNGRPSVVVFLTDGQPTIGETRDDEILAHVKHWNEGLTRIFCFGIGLDVNTHLLDRIAEQTRAANQYVLPEEDIEGKVSVFFSKIKQPALANPTLQFAGGIRASRLYPSPLPDLFMGEQLVVVGRYSGRGSSSVVIEGSVNGESKKFSREVNFPDTAENNFIPRLWATRRVGYLLDEIRLHGENPELRDEVTGLARKYGIVTPYTAYLISDDEARRGVPLTAQSLPVLHNDSAARAAGAANWLAFQNKTDGVQAVAGANYDNILKNATFAGDESGRIGLVEADRALGVPIAVAPSTSAEEPNIRLAQYSEQGRGRFVAGRNAFQNNNQWTDSEVQKFPNAKHQRIRFNSTEYFTFASRHPNALPWLALGQNVQFVLDGTIYEIYD
jgi:Ca-activated chloride channel family protein